MDWRNGCKERYRSQFVFDKGVSAGLRIWLAFLLVLVLAKYGVVQSLCLGALAGIAGGYICAWWQAKGKPSFKSSSTRFPNLSDRVKVLGTNFSQQGRRVRWLRRKPPSLRSRQ